MPPPGLGCPEGPATPMLSSTDFARAALAARLAWESEAFRMFACTNQQQPLHADFDSMHGSVKTLAPMRVEIPKTQQVAQNDVQHEVNSPTRLNRLQDLGASTIKWSDLASGTEERTIVCLQGLPSSLCDDKSCMKILTNANLSQHVQHFKCPANVPRGRSGNVVVTAVDSVGVAAIAKYFHGRQWGTAAPVRVRYSNKRLGETAPIAMSSPIFIESRAHPKGFGKQITEASEVSTQVGDE